MTGEPDLAQLLDAIDLDDLTEPRPGRRAGGRSRHQDPASGVTPEITSLARQGRKAQAIKRYRELNPGTGFKQAKDIIDQIT